MKAYWKFENDGVDEMGLVNATITGVPEFNVPSIVSPDRISEGSAVDGVVLAWPGTIGEYAQAPSNAALKTLNATIVISFQCDSLNEASTPRGQRQSERAGRAGDPDQLERLATVQPAQRSRTRIS